MKPCLNLVFALLVVGCRCEPPPSRAEVLFLASMEPGATELTPSQVKVFQACLSRLSVLESEQLLRKLDGTNLWERESLASAAWKQSAFLVADEVLSRNQDVETLANSLASDASHYNENGILLWRMGETNPDRGWNVLKAYYRILESWNYEVPGPDTRISIPYFQTVQEHHPKLARKYLLELSNRDSSNTSPFHDLRADAFAACFSACSSSEELVSFLEWIIESKFDRNWVSFFDAPYYLTMELKTQGALNRGISVLARMDPLVAQEWIKENAGDLPVSWGVGFVAGAVEYAPEVQKGNPRYENRYEEAMEFVARQTSPESEVFKKLIEGFFRPEPKMKARLLEIQKATD